MLSFQNDYQEAGEMAEKVCDYLEANVNKTGELPTVEEVQDAVEKVLVESGHAKTAKAYILYRADRTRVREMNTSLMRILHSRLQEIAILSVKTPTLTEIPQWAQCSNTALRVQSSSTRCMFLLPSIQRRTGTAIFISTTLTF